jgi:hypothetical protein
VQRLIQISLLIAVLCGLGGCFVPDYGYGGGYPVGGYAPYSYGFYGRGYAPDFGVHRSWEEHYGGGHHTSFAHYAPAAGGGSRGGGGGRR